MFIKKGGCEKYQKVGIIAALTIGVPQ